MNHKPSFRPLPPLPLVDGALIFDNSTLESLVCPRLYELHNLRRRELATSRAGRNFGACMHIGWRERYSRFANNAVPPDGTTLIQSAMVEYMAAHPQPPEDFRTLEHAYRVMDCYNRIYGNEPWRVMLTPDGKSTVETSFLHPLGEVTWHGKTFPLWYSGRIDMYVEDNYGEWTFDHKTAFMFGKGWEQGMAMDSGQIGYCWQFKQQYGHAPRGYIIDGVRIRRPRREDEYTGAPPVDKTDLCRLPYFVTDDVIDAWRFNTIKRVQSILYYYDDSYFPQNYKMCVNKYGACDMYQVCSAASGSQDSILYGDNYIDNDWSPLNKTANENES